MPLETLADTPLYNHLAIRGNLDTAGSHAIDPDFHARTAAQRKHAIVDVSDVQIIASLGMGMRIGCAHSLARHKKKLILVNATPLCTQALRAMKMDLLIPIVGSLDEALGSIQPRPAGA